MKVSLSWLADYVAHALTPDEVAAALTLSGLEVEEVARTGADVPAGVVVGHVLSTAPHPNADRLTLCRVDVGAEAPLAIVCGASNVAAGQTVVVAPPGTTLNLPGKDGGRTPITLDRRKIRGEVSEGMICAEDELGLGDDHSGILILDDDGVPGEAFHAYRARHGAPSDTVLTLNVTPNRPDATGHVGVARDVAALSGMPLRLPDVPATDAGASARVSVRLDAPEGCPRYVALVIEDVTVGPSPAWLRDRLEAVGVRSISNVVDVTNFVMLELGQPLHAFDLGQIAGGQIVVRAAEAGETFTTLDGKGRTLPAGTLLICDGGNDDTGRPRPVALGGLMGGLNSEVTDATTTVLLESAYFDPSTIRRAAKALGLSTDASYRFERGVDPEGQAFAAARAAALLADVAGGRVASGVVDKQARAHERPRVTLRLDRLAALLGVTIPEAEVRRILTALGFEVETDGTLGAFAEGLMEGRRVDQLAAPDALALVVPPWRPDVTREVDVIEEVGRIYGYDRLPEPAHTPVPAVPPVPEPLQALRRRVKGTLAGAGFREVWATSFASAATAERFRLEHPAFASGQVVSTYDPARTEPLALRPALLPGLLSVAAYNQRQGRRALRLFEAGHVYRTGDKKSLVKGYDEREHVALVIAGLADDGGWDARARPADLFDAKGAVGHLLSTLRLDASFAPADVPGDLLTDALTVLIAGQSVGVVGMVAPAPLDLLEGRAPVAYAELNLTALLSFVGDAPRPYRPFSRQPLAERDLAFVLPRTEAVGDVLATIQQAGAPLVRDVRVFDLYEGTGVPDGQRSVAFKLTLGAEAATLRDAEVDAAVQAVRTAVETQHHAALRG